MLWVLQHNLWNEEGFHSMLTALDRMEIPHVIVRCVPVLNKIVPVDFDSNSYYGDMDDVPEVEIDPNQLIMVCGGLSLSKVALARDWKPGAFTNENFRYEKWQENVVDFLLNPRVFIDRFDRIGVPDQEFFIRPCEDNKAFTGVVMTPDEFVSWRDGVLAVANDLHGALRPDTLVSIAKLQKIYAEYRFFVVDGELVTWSQYKLGDRVTHSAHVSEEVIMFAYRMVKRWQPARAFVIDVAHTPDGYKIIEYNSLNSAGFYAADCGRLVAAIEAMNFDREK